MISFIPCSCMCLLLYFIRNRNAGANHRHNEVQNQLVMQDADISFVAKLSNLEPELLVWEREKPRSWRICTVYYVVLEAFELWLIHGHLSHLN